MDRRSGAHRRYRKDRSGTSGSNEALHGAASVDSVGAANAVRPQALSGLLPELPTSDRLRSHKASSSEAPTHTIQLSKSSVRVDANVTELVPGFNGLRI